MKSKCALQLFVGFFLLSRTVLGQWVTQQIALAPGWNAVYLQVDPAQPQCRDAFATVAGVESVWKYNRHFTTVEYDQNPNVLLPEPEHWLIWLPPTRSERFLNKLEKLQGGQTYLIRMSDSARPVTWSVKGTPTRPGANWLPNAMNLVGFPVDAASPPSFARLLADTVGINSAPGAGSGVYALGPDGKEYQIRQTERTLAQPGTAYWVKLGQFIRQAEPFVIEGEYAASGYLDFGVERREATLTFHNQTAAQVTLTVRAVSSEPAPAGAAEVAGPVPLAYFVSDPVRARVGWVLLPDPLELTLGSGESQDLRLAVRRSAMQPYNPTGNAGAAYESFLEVRESPHGVTMLVPLSAESVQIRRIGPMSASGSTGTVGSSNLLGELPLYHLAQGLWVGQVQITNVSRPIYGTNVLKDVSPYQPVASPLQTRLLLHVDAAGQTKLLQRVLLAWESGSTNSQYQLYADEGSVPASDKEVYRISTATLPLMPPLPMVGAFGTTLATNVFLGYDDPVNPFKHAFHPDHDNKDALFSTNLLPAGVESYDITRRIRLDFAVAHKDESGNYVPPGSVMAFDGAQSSVSVGPSLALGSAFTVEAWVKAAAYATQDQYLFYCGNADTNAIGLKLDATTGTMTFAWMNGNDQKGLTTSQAFPTNQWVHVAAISDGFQTPMILWNGQLISTNVSASPSTATRTNVYFGRGLSATNEFFAGKMYGLTIWGDDRSATEVSQDMYLSPDVTSDHLVAYFPASEGGGATMQDAGGSSLAAALTGVAWDDSESYRRTYWDIGEAEGVYSETIEGLRPQPLQVQGSFHLQRISQEATLH